LGLAVLSSAAACGEDTQGLRRTPDGDGPKIVFDLTAQPIPDLPLPNNIATRPDPTSPTGVRLNASMLATTDYEATLRERLDGLTGWGTSQPVTLSFDAPIDLQSLLDGHRDYETNPEGGDYNFDNDVVFLIDVTEGSPTYQEFVPLDFGDGNFPDILRRTDLYFEADPNVTSTTLLNESFDEDRNKNGILDPGEDIDMDGRLDKPNVLASLDGKPGVDPYKDVATFYDFATNTLSGRPLMPLLGATTYAVVVTEGLKGTDGEPVRSPFDFVNHADQTDDLQPALGALAGVGLGAEDVAFAWTFTTQDVHHDMVMIRNGLYGAGPMAWLAEEFPPVLTELHITRDEEDPVPNPPLETRNRYVIPGEQLHRLVEPLAGQLFGAQDTSVMEDTHRYPAYHVSGSFETPYFLDMEGESRWNGTWPSNLADPSIRERIGRRKVNFLCSIPRWQYKQAGGFGDTREEAEAASSPVAMIGHGYSLNRMTHLGGYSTSYNKWGVTGCEIDAPDHGLELDKQTDDLLTILLHVQGLTPLADVLKEGRARDIDDDGAVDSGDTWFGADGYRIRDSFRQSVLDYMVMLRVFRNFDGTRKMPWDVDGDGNNEIAGDFNGDGHVDFGGEDVDYFASGESLGGIMSSILAGIEPQIVAAAPISGGGGLTSLALKTEQGGAYEPFSLQVMGPAWIGERDTENGGVRIYQLYANGNDDERTTFAHLDESEVQIGDVVVVTNETKRISHCAQVLSAQDIPEEFRASLPGLQPDNMVRGNFWERFEGSFRVGLPSDRGDRVSLTILEGREDEHVVHVDPDNLECESLGNTRVRRVIDTWEVGASYKAGWYNETIEYAEGDPLVSLEQGLGFKRAHSLARKAINLVGLSIEPGDPVNYAPYYSKYKLEYQEGDETFENEPHNVLDVVTIGDPAVPVSLGVHIARAAGFIDFFNVDDKWGKTENRAIIDSGALEAITWLNRHPGYAGQLMDVDNYSESENTADPDTKELSQDGFDSPRLDPPLRAFKPTFESEDGMSGLGMPMPEANGQHVMTPGSHSNTQIFDVGTYMVNVIAYYFHTRGTEIRTEFCMEQTDGCDWMPKTLKLPGEGCTEDDECTSSECVDNKCVYPAEFYGDPVEG
jgi:hypothetical protein